MREEREKLQRQVTNSRPQGISVFDKPTQQPTTRRHMEQEHQPVTTATHINWESSE